MNIITPTIGRKVWFHPNGLKLTTAGPIEVFDEKQALDATIVCVYGDLMVNLSVTDHGGRVHSVRSCTLRQDGDAAPTGYYCEWMPYQTGQAIKLTLTDMAPLKACAEKPGQIVSEPAPTYGEKAVGLSFNPGGNPAVNACKQSFVNVIDSLDELRRTSTDPEAARLASVAITQAQTAQMWAVKAITWSA